MAVMTLFPKGYWYCNWSSYGTYWHYECIDEDPSDEDSTFIYGVGNLAGYFALQDGSGAAPLLVIPAGFKSINKITVCARCKITSGSSVGSLYTYLGQYWSNYWPSEDFSASLTGEYATLRTDFLTNPLTSSPWENGDLFLAERANPEDWTGLVWGLQIGISSGSGGGGDQPGVRVTQFYVEVDYNGLGYPVPSSRPV